MQYTGSKLSGRVALVTGASKGIGRGLALGLAQAGAHVAVNYKTDEAGAESICAAISDIGSRTTAILADIGDKAAFEKMVDQVCDQFGRLDVLVNNAARTRF